MQSQYNAGNQPRAMNPNQYGNQGGYQGYGNNYAQGYAQGYAQQQQSYNYAGNQQPRHTAPQQKFNNYQQNNQQNYSSYQHQGNGFNQVKMGQRAPFKKQFKKKPANNIQDNLRKFSAVQQVTMLAPEAVIDVQPALQDKNCALWKGVASYRGRTIEAYQVGKKKTRQALCSKIVKEFKLLDHFFGNGVSEQLNIGMHTTEVSAEQAAQMTAQGIAAQNKAASKVEAANASIAEISAETCVANMTEEQLLNEPATESINGSECTTPIASKTGMKPAKTPISTLSQQFANKEQKPKYEFLPAEGINNGFEVTCELFDGTQFKGIGRGKKTAQHHAAYLAIQALFPTELSGLELPAGAGSKAHPVQNNTASGIY